jgi:putative protease
VIAALLPENKASAELLKPSKLESPSGIRTRRRTAVFYDPKSIPDEAWTFFDRIFLPLEYYSLCSHPGAGVMLPEVIFDSQSAEVRDMLTAAVEKGATEALVGNIGHLELVKSCGLKICGDLRFNVANPSTVAALQKLGIDSVIASPELTLAQLRDLGGDTAAVVYGRLPLMLTEKCVGKELGNCQECENGRLTLTDRRGVSFPVLKRYGHRSVIFNSVPIYMADRKSDLERYRIASEHFIFSIESKKQAAAVIDAYKNGSGSTSTVRRLK